MSLLCPLVSSLICNYESRHGISEGSPAVEKWKNMIVALSQDEYQRLANVADREVRSPEQQAAFIVRRALSRQKTKEAAV